MWWNSFCVSFVNVYAIHKDKCRKKKEKKNFSTTKLNAFQMRNHKIKRKRNLNKWMKSCAAINDWRHYDSPSPFFLKMKFLCHEALSIYLVKRRQTGKEKYSRGKEMLFFLNRSHWLWKFSSGLLSQPKQYLQQRSRGCSTEALKPKH